MEFHDRAVVASLKQVIISLWRRCPKQFHDRAVVASLKLMLGLPVAVRSWKIPRPRGRGLIEAGIALADGVAVATNSTPARSWPH